MAEATAVRQFIKHKHQGSLPNIRLEFYSFWKKHIFQMTVRNLASERKQPLMSPLKKLSLVSFLLAPSLTVSSLSSSQLGMERQCHYLYSSSLIQSYRLEDFTLNSTYGKKTHTNFRHKDVNCSFIYNRPKWRASQIVCRRRTP